MAVNLSPVGGVAAQFFDNDGNVLSGGLIYTYLAGSTTPATTYTTSAGNIAHSNPIVLDSAGRVPASEIWLTDNVVYKFVIKNSTGVLIATYDNVAGISTLTLPIDSSNITYDAPYTYSVATTVQTKLSEFISVKDFGATGDGVTDDTVSIQNALNAATAAGQKLFFPAGTYIITDTLQPTSAGGDSNVILVGDGANTLIKWGGATDLNKAMFGWYSAQVGTWNLAGMQDMRWKGMGKVGYVVLFEMTDTSGGAARRELENNMFKNVWFSGSKKAALMVGKWSINTHAQSIADGDDINFDGTTFDGCTFVNFEGYAAKLTGQNIYNTVFRNCFMWSGNSSEGTDPALAQGYIFAVSAGNTIIQASIFQRLFNTGKNDGTDRVACMRSAFGEFKVYGGQTEDARVFNSNNEGSPDRPHYINGVYANDSYTNGDYAIFNESSSPITVDSCSFGHQAAIDDYRNIYSAGALTWNSSVTAKTTPTEMTLGAYAKQCTFNGRRFTDVFPLNENFHLNSWSVPAATYANATTNDYYLNRYAKICQGGTEGTLQQATSAFYNRTVPRLECTVLGATPLRLTMRGNVDVTDYAGKSIWVAVGGQHNGAITNYTELFTAVTTDSTGGAGGGTIFANGNVFVAWQKLDLSAGATYVTAELRLNKVAHVDLTNFLIVPDEIGMQAMLFGLAQQSVYATNGLPVSFTHDGLSVLDTGNTYTYQDTLQAGDSNFYLVSANHGYLGAETALVMAHALASNAYVSKVSNLSSGSGASISVSATGLVVSIAVDGTSRAFVRKIKLTDY